MLSRPTNTTTSPTHRHTTGQPSAPSHTRWAWIARTRLGFIPAGDALPSHDTPAGQLIDWTFSPTRPPVHTLHPVTERTVNLGDLDPIAKHETPTATIIETEFIEERPLAALSYLPWSVLLAVAGLALVYMATLATGIAGSPVGSLAFGSVSVCGLLLIVAQLIGGPKR